ncbi:phenylpyruvate tautomerase PptA (4-oxalocrotonate tautomerase family) [Nonomuraea muscovyensis]|uniref:Phenylpyruvate tautomerase PptA (4-oxalocrotonate tautomerase family) n=1 Tax=Nonomuraea muscovyensis TaxID=1124761 RepID=A0A7X0C2K4_9ACTN|nr:tautomerase family protein [Nonomuraea muscovyensis]MBB6347380.1 phenylpyruvate tautomerase PptA (4-oxalocrotonate tautomerase family) [Nonomuraea muscovyensis]
MPFVRVDALGADSDRLDALGRAVHDALVETIGIPPDDRFQVLTGHDGTRSTLRYDDYLGVHRDSGIVYVAITMRRGRTPAQKQALYRRIAELAHDYAGTEPRNVFVTLTENESIDWSLGEGVAQYAPSPDVAGPPSLSGPDHG